jgi:hypothetical protein
MSEWPPNLCLFKIGETEPSEFGVPQLETVV